MRKILEKVFLGLILLLLFLGCTIKSTTPPKNEIQQKKVYASKKELCIIYEKDRKIPLENTMLWYSPSPLKIGAELKDRYEAYFSRYFHVRTILAEEVIFERECDYYLYPKILKQMIGQGEKVGIAVLRYEMNNILFDGDKQLIKLLKFDKGDRVGNVFSGNIQEVERIADNYIQLFMEETRDEIKREMGIADE